MLMANEGSKASDVISLRERLDGLREEYRRTHRLLEQEGRRLNGFLAKPAAGNIPVDALESQKILASLTPRERDILRCIAEGCSTKATAERLGIRFKTAACHRYRVMQKLGVHETTALVRIAIRSGIITP